MTLICAMLTAWWIARPWVPLTDERLDLAHWLLVLGCICGAVEGIVWLLLLYWSRT